MKTGLKSMAVRTVQAEENFISNVCQIAEISKADGEKVLRVYRKLKLVKMDAVNGVLSVKHGAFLDALTIKNAVAYEL